MSKAKLYGIYGKSIPGLGVAKDLEFAKNNPYYYFPGNQPIADSARKAAQEALIEGQGFYDNQCCVNGFRLYSQQLKDILENSKSPDDRLQWLDATVTWNGETRPYYVLHFYEDVDVVDLELSGWDGQSYQGMRRVFVERKIVNHNVFTDPRMKIDGLKIYVKPEIELLKRSRNRN